MKYSLGADDDGVFSIDVDSFSPGPHTLNITATSSDGEVDTAFISFVISATLGKTSSQFNFHEPKDLFKILLMQI